MTEDNLLIYVWSRDDGEFLSTIVVVANSMYEARGKALQLARVKKQLGKFKKIIEGEKNLETYSIETGFILGL